MNVDDVHRAESNWQPSRADLLAHELLDDAFTEQDVANLSPEDRRRLADLQWLDAMLEHAHGRNADAVARVVSSTLTRLRAQGSTNPTSHNPRGGSIGWTMFLVAASVLLTIGLLFWPSSPASASAMVEKAYQAALLATDREYRITLTSDNTERVARLAPHEAILHVRGGDRFLLTFPGPLGRATFIGRDRDTYWFAPPVGPVLQANSETFVGQWLERSSLNMPYLQLTSALKRMNDRYELSRQPDESIDGATPLLHHIIASRRSEGGTDSRSPLPVSLELWTDRKTDVVRRLIVTRSSTVAVFPSERITFDLVSEEPLPDAHYRPQIHAPNRAMTTLPRP